MADLFGTEGLINHLTLIIGAGYVLGALLFRKNVANDLMGFPFSVIGSSAAGILSFILLDILWGNFKGSLLISLSLFFLGGFFLAQFINDGDSE